MQVEEIPNASTIEDFERIADFVLKPELHLLTKRVHDAFTPILMRYPAREYEVDGSRRTLQKKRPSQPGPVSRS